MKFNGSVAAGNELIRFWAGYESQSGYMEPGLGLQQIKRIFDVSAITG